MFLCVLQCLNVSNYTDALCKYLVHGHVPQLHSNGLRADDRHMQERDKLPQVELAEHVRQAGGNHCLSKHPPRYNTVSILHFASYTFAIY